jgi:hypothetical protein
MANEVTTNMGIELPTPGVTGALGVELPGASWMELQNEGFRKVDVHNHGAAGGAPIDASALLIAADLSFSGFRATDLGSAVFVNQVAPLSAARSIYFYGGDFYIVNGSAAPVRITNGASIAAAAGNITGLSGTAALTWNSGLGVFIFESATGIKAPVYMGPISIYEPVSGGKRALISVPAGLAADYAITLPSALPATTKVLTMSASGVITPSDAFVDNVTIQSVAGILSLKDAAVTQAKMAAKTVTSSSVGNWSNDTTSFTDVTSVTVSFTATGTRPVIVFIAPDGSATGQIGIYAGAGVFSVVRDTTDICSLAINGESTNYNTFPNIMCFDAPSAGAHTYKLRGRCITGGGTSIFVQNVKINVCEL